MTLVVLLHEHLRDRKQRSHPNDIAPSPYSQQMLQMQARPRSIQETAVSNELFSGLGQTVFIRRGMQLSQQSCRRTLQLKNGTAFVKWVGESLLWLRRGPFLCLSWYLPNVMCRGNRAWHFRLSEADLTLHHHRHAHAHRPLHCLRCRWMERLQLFGRIVIAARAQTCLRTPGSGELTVALSCQGKPPTTKITRSQMPLFSPSTRGPLEAAFKDHPRSVANQTSWRSNRFSLFLFLFAQQLRCPCLAALLKWTWSSTWQFAPVLKKLIHVGGRP
jgi:hypothetical protein